MKITILGTRGEIEASAPYHSKKSGVLLDDTLLLDCGEQQFLKYKPDAILITHLHPDHAFFVKKEIEKFPCPVYAPEKYEDIPIISTRKKSSFTIKGYRIRTIPTLHSMKVKSNAYLITKKRKKILYTGDMIWIEKRYHHLLKDLDLVITEASYMRKGGLVRRDKKTGKIYGHTGIPNLINVFKRYTDVIIFMHFGTWFYKDIKKARKQFKVLAKQSDIELIVGYDGLELEI